MVPPVGSPLKSKQISMYLPYKVKVKIPLLSYQYVTYKSGGIFVVKSSGITQPWNTVFVHIKWAEK